MLPGVNPFTNFPNPKSDMLQTITENSVEIPTPDGTADGFLYHAEGESLSPGLIFLTDIGGIRPAQQQMAKRIAAEGYGALIPNIFYRTSCTPVFDFKPNFAEERTKKRLAELSEPLTPEAIERDASAYVDFLSKQEVVKSGGLGVVGHCFSGAMALRMAATRPDKIAAVALFHAGRLFTDSPTSPHLLLPKIKAQLYFGHAVEDRGMPAESIKKLEHALRIWGGKYKSETYEGAYHSWTTPDSPVYNHDQAERAFQQLKNLLATTLDRSG